MSSLKNVIVVGGKAAARQLASILPDTHRVLLVEPHSHFHHLFAFPRFAVLGGHEHKAFIPYRAVFKDPDSHVEPRDDHKVIQAKVTEVHPHHVIIQPPWEGSEKLSFENLIIATGTRLPSPGTVQHDDKPQSVDYFRTYQQEVVAARSIIIVGGGAVGVQMATDLKELYPEKEITLVHSRNVLMPRFHENLHGIISKRLDELGVKLVTGSRATQVSTGSSKDGTPTEVTLASGRLLTADLVIPATGQSPNTQLLESLQAYSATPLLNPVNGFIQVLPTLQFEDPAFSHIYAIGDVADTGMHKAARPGSAQAGIMAKNVLAQIEGRIPDNLTKSAPAGIHMTLGLVGTHVRKADGKAHNVVFRNPNVDEGETGPWTKMKHDGSKDMGIDGVWLRRGVLVTKEDDYHL